MNAWLNALTGLNSTGILVTVAAVEGSGPREPGAKMFVTDTGLFDTIGGGHLELCATRVAREMLGLSAVSLRATRRLERYSLGPALGQCCGGVVHLVFERIEPDSGSVLRLAGRLAEGKDSWRLVSIDSVRQTELLTSAAPDWQAGCTVFADEHGQRWMRDPCPAIRPHLMLLGAGHVGAALVRALADLPCRVTWVDERIEQFPAERPVNVRLEITDTPEACIAAAPAGVSFLVMTHSHALDQVLTEHILRRTDFAWFGLIGSKTKRVLFERRLLERGIAQSQLDRMVCPIGISGIAGKSPAVIALAVAAQLMQVWELRNQESHGNSF